MDYRNFSVFEKQLRYAYLSNNKNIILEFYKAHYPNDFYKKASRLSDKAFFGMVNKFIYSTPYFDREEKEQAKAWLTANNLTTEMSLVSH